MHELALVTAILRVHLGELQGLGREVIRVGIGAGCELVEEEASFRCRRWNLRELELSSEVGEYIRCPSCGTHDYEIAGGRGAGVSLVLEG